MNRQILRNIIFAGLFIVPFVPFLVYSGFFFPFITTKAFVFRVVIEIVFAVWALLALADPEVRPRISWITWALRIFLAVILLADIFGLSFAKSFWSNAERMEGFVSLIHLALFYIVATGFFKEIDWKRWWNTSLAASFLMCVYGVFQLLGVLEIHQGGARVDGSLGNAAYLAVYLLIHIFIALWLMLRAENKSLRWVYGLLIAFQTVILYYTATRGAILGLLGGLLVAAVLSLRDREAPRLRQASRAYVGLFVAIVVGFLLVRNASFVQQSPVLSRFAQISVADWKSEGRSFVWPMALKGIAERPILGWGQDNFNYVFNEHYSPEMFRLEPWFDRAHNIFLDWGIAGGILGLLAYLSLYATLLYYIWSKTSGFSRGERAVLVGLIAAYFFNNLFVFDNLTSYILFFALLAYVNGRSQAPLLLGEKRLSQERAVALGGPIALVAAVAVLYFVNVRPIIANTRLIDALQAMQSGDPQTAIAGFESSYGEARLGRPEIVEQIATNAPTVLGASNLSTEAKNAFFTFAKAAVEKQAADLPTDARYQLVAGTFLEETGQFDEALSYLNAAKALIPGKQLVYYEIATAYINKAEYPQALDALRTAYELDTEDTTAEQAYLVGAIYARDAGLEATLRADLETKDPNALFDNQVYSAYLSTNRYNDLLALLTEALQKNPNDPQSYVNIASVYLKAGDKQGAIAALEKLGSQIPSYKATADSYIEQINNGTLK